jgi:hypothetical protein
MRKLLLIALVGTAAAAESITLDTAKRFEFTDCASGGSAAQTVTPGNYLFRVTDKDTFVCMAATCATGGEKFPLGTLMVISVARSTSVSCRSSDSTGDAVFTSSN